MAATEVTWDQYDLFVYGIDAAELGAAGADAIARPSKPYLPPDRGFGHAEYPAMSMSFHAAREFCRWLSLKTGKAYRLPTEYEWQCACHALSLILYSTRAAEDWAWYAGNAGGTTHPVGRKEANDYGLHDMYGNVAEWCVAEDGSGVVRGGSYLDDWMEIGCDARTVPSPSWNASDPQLPKSTWWLADCAFVGFRVVCEDGSGGTEGRSIGNGGDQKD
jgi:formylglycine-generating enzyme required for sulfatase activity